MNSFMPADHQNEMENGLEDGEVLEDEEDEDDGRE